MNHLDQMADMLHDEQCTRNRCNYWLVQGRDGAHRLYYCRQAEIMYDRLIPVLGHERILPALRIILEELW